MIGYTCYCKSAPNYSGGFLRNYSAVVVADSESVATASWTEETIHDWTYYWYKLYVDDVSTDDAEAILDPVRFSVLEDNDDANVMEGFYSGGTPRDTRFSKFLPSGSHISDGNLAFISSEWLRTRVGTIGVLYGENFFDTGTNLGTRDGVATAPRRGVRPRYLKIYADGDDLLGLIDLDDITTLTAMSAVHIWSMPGPLPFRDFDLSGLSAAKRLTQRFRLEYDVEYSFDVWYEFAIEPKSGDATTGGGKVAHAIRKGPITGGMNSLSATVPSTISHLMSFSGLRLNPAFDPERHAYQLELEFSDPADEWDWPDGEVPHVITLEAVYSESATIHADTPNASTNLLCTLSWNKETPLLEMQGAYESSPGVWTGRTFVPYRTQTSDYADRHVCDGDTDNTVVTLPAAPFIVRWGVDGIWSDPAGSTYFYPSYPYGNSPSQLTTEPAGIPYRIKVTRVNQATPLRLVVSWSEPEWTIGQTIELTFEIINESRRTYTDCSVICSSHSLTFSGQPVAEILKNESAIVTADYELTSGDVSRGYIDLTTYVTSHIHLSTKTTTPDTVRIHD